MAILIKVEAKPEHWYTSLDNTDVPKGVFTELRTRWLNVHSVHEVAELPSIKNDDGTETPRCVLFVDNKHHLEIDKSSAFRYIVHGETASQLVERVNVAAG